MADLRWGAVDAGMICEDRDGNLYVVEPQNDRGFLLLLHLSGGKNLSFEAMDEVDITKFKLFPARLRNHLTGRT